MSERSLIAEPKDKSHYRYKNTPSKKGCFYIPSPYQGEGWVRFTFLQNRFFGRFGDFEFNHGFSLNLNGFAGCRVSAHSGGAVDFN